MELVNTMLKENDLCDIWRARNPLERRFTWRCPTPLIQRRLDYFLIENELQPFVTESEILPGISTDHSAVRLLLSSFPLNAHGPAYWRLNVSLLQDNDYIKAIQNSYPIWKQEYNDLGNNPAKRWDFLKYKIRNFSITFSKVKARNARQRRINLEKELQNIEGQLSTESNNEIIDKYENINQELECIYDYIAEGHIIRSRAELKWVKKIHAISLIWKKKIDTNHMLENLL
jgi:hypothetical protein